MFQCARTSYEVTESSAIAAYGDVLLCSVLVITDGTNAATVIVYDKPSSTGIGVTNKIAEWTVPGANQYGGRNWTFPVRCKEGIYVSISGTGASAIVEYM